MSPYKLLLLAIALSFVHSNEMNEITDVLNRYVHNLDYLDMSMELELIDNDGKLDKKLRYSIVWPDVDYQQSDMSAEYNNSLSKMIRVDVLFPDKLSKLVYWEHHKVNFEVDRWITIPRNGKIKKIGDDNLLAKEFSLAKIDLSNFIDSTATFQISGMETIDSTDYCVIDIESKLKKIKATALLDTSDLVLKSIDVYNNRNIHTHSYVFSDFTDFEGRIIPLECLTDDIKNKKNYRALVSNLNSITKADSLFVVPTTQ